MLKGDFWRITPATIIDWQFRMQLLWWTKFQKFVAHVGKKKVRYYRFLFNLWQWRWDIPRASSKGAEYSLRLFLLLKIRWRSKMFTAQLFYAPAPLFAWCKKAATGAVCGVGNSIPTASQWRRRCKTSKSFHKKGSGQKSLKISSRIPLLKAFRQRSLSSRSISIPSGDPVILVCWFCSKNNLWKYLSISDWIYRREGPLETKYLLMYLLFLWCGT